MAGLDHQEEVLPDVEIYLYPNTIPGAPKGGLIARVSEDAVLDIADVCAAMKNRGGFEGDCDQLESDINRFYDEMMYQVFSGFGVRNKYYTVRMKIGGTWANEYEHYDPEKHPLSITFRGRGKLEDILKRVRVRNAGLARAASYITALTDAKTGLVDDTVTLNEDIIITGHHIKITKGEPGCGLFLRGPMSSATPRDTELTSLTENTPSKIIARVPASGLTVGQTYKIIVKTKFTGSQLLKEVRVIEGAFTLTAKS